MGLCFRRLKHAIREGSIHASAKLSLEFGGGGVGNATGNVVHAHPQHGNFRRLKIFQIKRIVQYSTVFKMSHIECKKTKLGELNHLYTFPARSI